MQFNIDTSMPILFEQVDDTVEDSQFYPVSIWIAHSNLNKNKSSFSEELLTSMSQESLSGIPICGYIQVKDDNTIDFKSHEERIIIEKDSIKIEYIGRAYGYVLDNPNPRFENKMTPTGEKRYLVCDGKLWRKFANCIEIFDNNGGILHQSMELERSSIEGYVDKNGVFNFTKAKFEAACILSNDIGTGMDGSVIEKFSSSSIQTQFQELSEEYEFYLATEGGENVKKQTDKNEGDVTMELLEQKNNLFAKFSNLVEEDIKDIKASLDQFSLEDLELKLKELSDAKFSLTVSQLITEIRSELCERKIIVEYWGDNYEEDEFYFRDIKDNLVIVIHNNYVDYFGIPFTQNNDSVILDFEGKIPYLPDWRPKVEGDSVDDATESEFQLRIKSYVEKTTQKVKDSFNVVESDEYKKLQSDFNEIKTTSESVLLNFTSLKEEYETIKNQNVEFSEWKNTKERSEKESLINSDEFKLFTEEDKKPFFEIADKYSISELKDQLYLALGKKASQFSFNVGKQPKEISFNFENANKEEVKNEKPYAQYIRDTHAQKQIK